MKNALIFPLILIVSTITFSQNVTIPDANFKACLVGNTNINTNFDGEIQVSEAISFTGYISCIGDNISDLTGIESFINITELNCANNQLTSLNITQNIALTHLRCYNNSLTSLDVSQNISLVQLICDRNQLSSLNISQNTLLNYINCGENLLTSLDVNQNTQLVELRCHDNQISSLNVTQNTLLTLLYCYENLLSNLNISQNTFLVQLICERNQLTSLDLSQNLLLEYLDFSRNQLTIIDLSLQTSLTEIYCYSNQLTNLNLSNNTLLTYLRCHQNNLISLNMLNGNNANVTFFNSEFNPNLTCILVDDASYSATNWMNVDPVSTFVNNQTECNTLSSESHEFNDSFTVYPNPTSYNLNISYNHPIDKIEVYNVFGKKIIETIATTIVTSILTDGVYFLKIYTQNKISVKRFIKQ